MNEKQFLITLAIRSYNEQYGKDFRPDECDIRSIQTRQRYDRSYEIRTNREDDFTRIHLHLNFGDTDKLYPYRVELDHAVANGTSNLQDELFVSEGVIDSYYKNEGIYKFRRLEFDDYLSNILLMEDDTPLFLENNEQILLE